MTAPNTTLRTFGLHDITLDERLQMRADGLDEDFVDTLADTLADGGDLAPVTIFHRHGAAAYLADGFHRAAAYLRAKRKTIPAIVHLGTFDDAFRHALGANADQQAKPRTRKDLRRAVESAIINLIFSAPSKNAAATQTEIADLCKCTQGTVSNIFRALKAEREKPENTNFVESGITPPPPAQRDFFDLLEEDFSPQRHGLKMTLQMPYWTMDDYRHAAKLDAAAQLRAKIREIDADLAGLETALRKGAPAT